MTTDKKDNPNTAALDRTMIQEIRRSNVRVNVTYVLTWTYVVAIGYTLYMALNHAADVSDLAISILGSVSSAALGIIGFWFGSRTGQSATGFDDAVNKLQLANTTAQASAKGRDAQTLKGMRVEIDRKLSDQELPVPKSN